MLQPRKTKLYKGRLFGPKQIPREREGIKRSHGRSTEKSRTVGGKGLTKIGKGHFSKNLYLLEGTQGGEAKKKTLSLKKT